MGAYTLTEQTCTVVRSTQLRRASYPLSSCGSVGVHAVWGRTPWTEQQTLRCRHSRPVEQVVETYASENEWVFRMKKKQGFKLNRIYIWSLLEK